MMSEEIDARHEINDYPLCIEREPDPSTRRELRRTVSVATHNKPHNKDPHSVFQSTTDIPSFSRETTGLAKCKCQSISPRNLRRHRWRRASQHNEKQERRDREHGT